MYPLKELLCTDELYNKRATPGKVVPPTKLRIKKTPLRRLNFDTRIRSSKVPMDIGKFLDPTKKPMTSKKSPVQSFNSFYMTDYTLAQTVGPASHSQASNRPCCRCEKSQCLKLYCECFAAKFTCSGCHCTDCFNTNLHEDERNKAMTRTLEKNPWAFEPKILYKEKQVISAGNILYEIVIYDYHYIIG